MDGPNLLKISARHGTIRQELDDGLPTLIENDPVVWVEEMRPHIETKTYGLIPFSPYPYQKEIMRAVASGEAYVIDKARQLGVSTCIMVAFAHQLLYRQIATGIPLHCHVVANKEEVSIGRLLKMAKTALSTAKLHPWQKETLHGINPKVANNEIQYYTSEGQNYIRAHASGKDAGRSFDGNAALLEEFAFMPYGEGVWTSISPMLDDLEKAPVFIVSTYNGDGDLFCEFVDNHQALGLKHVPVDWRAHPDRWGNDDGATWKARSLKKFAGREDLWRQEYELGRIAVGTRFVDMHILEEHAAASPYLGSLPIPGHRYSKGVDIAGPERKGTVHVVIDLTVRPPQVVFKQTFSEQSTGAKIHAINELDARYPGPLFIDGTHDPAIAAQVSSRSKVAIRFTGGAAVTERIDRVENLRWRNIPRTLLLSWGATNLEAGYLVIHLDKFPDLYSAIKTANRAPGQKTLGENVDELDALLLANLPLTKTRRQDNNGSAVVGVEADSRLEDFRNTRW